MECLLYANSEINICLMSVLKFKKLEVEEFYVFKIVKLYFAHPKYFFWKVCLHGSFNLF